MYLNCHTGFSFKYGTLPVKALFEEARRCGIHKLIITEINNTASYIDMLRLCHENRTQADGLNRFGKPAFDLEIAVGIEFRRDHDLLFIALAKNNTGFEKINRFLSHHNLHDKKLPDRAPDFGGDVFVLYPFGRREPDTLREDEYIGVRAKEQVALGWDDGYQQFPDKFVALCPVTIANQQDYNVHRLLRAIDLNTLLSKLPLHRQASRDERMEPMSSLEARFAAYPGLLQRAQQLLEQCSLQLDFHTDKNKQSLSGDTQRDWETLQAAARRGFEQRYDASDPSLCERFEREMRIIQQKGFCGYYLIAYDLIRFAQRQGYDYVGRGSGANSLVAYCLGITNVDPIELNLYFERFLNEERSSPPDFDIDFSWDNRDAIYDYLFHTYGREHVCLLGTHVTYQGNSIIRELGKVFGLPKDEIDALVDNPAQLEHRDHITELIIRYAKIIIDKELPANISIHAGGVLITEKPIYTYTVTEVPPKGLPVSHFEMHAAEDIGIYKFDILSQRGLGHLKETVKHVRRNQGIDVNIHQFKVFKEDEKVKDLLRNSRAIGCFYVESPAMRMLLGKLRCDDYLTLVAASSIIRPGVARSGMMRAYIERFHATRNGGTYTSIHPKMDELMAETYGVMVYQEDVIKVAHHFAKLTLTQADVLRRGMSGKYRSREEFDRVRQIFFDNCRQEGYAPAVVERVWYEIESFSGYSFAKGHSASYAVESYQSLYLKAHYPLEFMVGVINNFGGFYRTEFYFHEARLCGGIIQAPCINRSEYLTSISGRDIWMGFIHLKGLETKIARQIAEERERQGPYRSLDNFLHRLPLGLEQVRMLIRVGAFRFTGKDKQRLLWEALLYYGQARQKRPAGELFDTEPRSYPLPMLQRNPQEDAFDEIELLGFPLCDPFTLLQTTERGNAVAADMLASIGKSVYMIGYLVTTKNTRTKDGQGMNFGTFYDHQGAFFDSVHFPNIARRYPFRGRGFYALKGKIVEDFGVPMLEVSWMDKLPMISKRADELMREPVDEPREHTFA